MADVSQIKLPNGSVYDLIDEKSGYITAEYIENKTDYEIPVSRVGEIVVGETAIGTDSTNFPTSKAVVDYVDERVVQEMDAIDVGVTGIQANGTSLSVVDGVVNIPAIGPNQSVGLMTDQWMQQIWNRLNSIPTSTSQLTNDSGFVTSDEKLAVSRNLNNGGVYEVVLGSSSNPINTETKFQSKTLQYSLFNNTASLYIGNNSARGELRLYGPQSNYSTRIRSTTTPDNYTIYLPDKEGTIALTSDIPSVPSWALQSTKPTYTANEVGALPSTTVIPLKTSQLTNDSGYLTASDIASVMTYKGTKANYAALPSTGNTTGDVWHLTDTGAEWAWDGSSWQELGTAIDLSGYVPKVVSSADDVSRITVASTGVTLNSSQNDSDYSSSIIVNGEVTISASGRAGTNTLSMNQNTTKIHNLVTPTADKDAANKKYVDDSIGALSIPTKVSDLTNDSGFISSYTETDPVFSASAASGITTTDISNWNGKSDTDEKLKTSSMGNNATYYPIVGNMTSTAETKYYSANFRYSRISGTDSLQLGQVSSKATGKGQLILCSGPYYTYLQPPAYDTINNDRTYTLPTSTGTLALTSDIPSVYSSTNTGGYLTMATLPIYDGTVV